MTRRYMFPALAFVVLALTAPVGAQSAHVLVPADKVQWGPAPPALPAGAEISVLEGNPATKGPITLRLKFPANYDIPPHWHSMLHHQEGHNFRLEMTYADEGGKTRLTWRIWFESAEEAERVRPYMAAANEQNFDRLAAQLATLQS